MENHLGRLGNKTFPFYQPGPLWRGFNTEGSLVGGYGRRLCEVSTNHCSNGSSAECRAGLDTFFISGISKHSDPATWASGGERNVRQEDTIKAAEIRR